MFPSIDQGVSVRITRDMVIAGVSAFELRAFFQRMQGSPWNSETVASELELGTARARQVVTQLVQEGYAEPFSGFQGRSYYQGTLKGGALGLATASKPLKRATAERLVGEALARAQKINEEPAYLFWVTKIQVFGSYLSDCATLGDVDLVIELTRRLPDKDEHFEAVRRYGQKAEENGRRFGTLVDQLFWAEVELLRIIKSKSGYLSIHLPSDDILKLVEPRTLYEYQPPPPYRGVTEKPVV